MIYRRLQLQFIIFWMWNIYLKIGITCSRYKYYNGGYEQMSMSSWSNSDWCCVYLYVFHGNNWKLKNQQKYLCFTSLQWLKNFLVGNAFNLLCCYVQANFDPITAAYSVVEYLIHSPFEMNWTILLYTFYSSGIRNRIFLFYTTIMLRKAK